MRLNEHRIMFLPEYYSAGKGNIPFPALSLTPPLLERASYSPNKAPLAVHIGFQIFSALPVCLPDCF